MNEDQNKKDTPGGMFKSRDNSQQQINNNGRRKIKLNKTINDQIEHFILQPIILSSRRHVAVNRNNNMNHFS